MDEGLGDNHLLAIEDDRESGEALVDMLHRRGVDVTLLAIDAERHSGDAGLRKGNHPAFQALRLLDALIGNYIPTSNGSKRSR